MWDYNNPWHKLLMGDHYHPQSSRADRTVTAHPTPLATMQQRAASGSIRNGWGKLAPTTQHCNATGKMANQCTSRSNFPHSILTTDARFATHQDVLSSSQIVGFFTSGVGVRLLQTSRRILRCSSPTLVGFVASPRAQSLDLCIFGGILMLECTQTIMGLHCLSDLVPYQCLCVSPSYPSFTPFVLYSSG